MIDNETEHAYYKRRIVSLQKVRQSYEPHWRELAQYILPRRGRWCDDDPNNKGGKKHSKIINSAATKAARTLASGMMAGLTSPARPWFRLTTPDPGMMEFGQVKQWLFIVEQRMRDVLQRSNLYTALPSVYKELGVFGQCPMLAASDLRTVVRFFPYPVGGYYLACGQNGDVDTLAREYKDTVRNVVDQFGIDNCSSRVREAYNRKQYDEWVDVVQFIAPRQGRAYGRADAKGMAYQSCYFEAASNEGKFLRDAGFRSFPIMAPRWDVASPEEIYGSSPGMEALGDIKQLQFNEMRKAAALDKLVDPPMIAPASMKQTRTSLLPGDVTYATNESQGDAFRPAYIIDARAVQFAGEENRTCEMRIQQMFYEDLFLMLAGREGPQMTAEEVIRRQEEKVHALGPILERLNSELLDPLIDRVYDLIQEHPDGLLPPPPRELEGQALKVDYISILAQAQKLAGSTGIERFATFVGNLAGVDPSVMDKWDLDQTIDHYATINGVPPDIVRADDAVAKLREQRQMQQQAAQAAAMAKPVNDAAGAVEKLSNAQPQPDSALTRMLGGVMGGAPPA